MIRLVQVSDTHLSPTHSYFSDNWSAFRDAMQATRPDLIVHSGDIAFNGPVVTEDLAFGRRQMDAVELPWLAIPGNHDIGEAAAFSRLDQPINGSRIAAWRRHIGPQWWCRDVGDWRLIGLDTALMASTLPEEAEQQVFLQSALSSRGGRQVMVFIHMPPFDKSPEDESFTTSVIPYPARRGFLDTCAGGGVRVIACGHQHIYRRRRYAGMDIVWAPPTAMVDVRKSLARRLRFPRPGYLEWTLTDKGARHRLVEPERMFVIDMSGWTRLSGGTVTTLPPRPSTSHATAMRPSSI